MSTCIWTGCARERVSPSATGIAHAHCAAHETRLLREAFGPVSWHDRARASQLPAMAVGGSPTSPGPLPGGDSPLAVPQSAGSLAHLSRRDAPVGAIRPASGGSTDRSHPAAEAAAAGALPG